jgi:hypothetical protein
MAEGSGWEGSPALALFRLATAWELAGRTEAALAGYRRALAADPGFVPAGLKLASLLLGQGRAAEALAHYERALAAGARDPALVHRAGALRQVLAGPEPAPRRDRDPAPELPRPSPSGGKIDLSDGVQIRGHRSGWGYAMAALQPLHSPTGVLCDGFVERNFAWRHWRAGVRPREVLQRMLFEGTFQHLATSEEHGTIPYTRPWVGFLHNPPGMPRWYRYQDAPQTIFAKDVWRRSLEWCIGLFALSEYHATWLRKQTGKPVSTLALPTEEPTVRFDFDRFLANPRKQIVQVGWWLRRLSAIHELPIPADNPLGYEKVRLVPRFFDDANAYLAELLAAERAQDGGDWQARVAGETRVVQHVANVAYDELLAQNIVLLWLYDASANNAVVECIVRGTPLLVNRLPAVEEYLGADYPLYVDDLADAAAKALDLDRLRAAHCYLRACSTRARLSAERFRQDFEASEVYRAIPA